MSHAVMSFYEREVEKYWELKRNKQEWKKLTRSEKCKLSRRITPLLEEAKKVAKWVGI